MAGSNRAAFLVTLAGLSALITAWGSGYYLAALNYPQKERYQPYRDTANKPAPTDSAIRLDASPETFKYRAPCNDPKGRDESDLCAQWKSANAAQDSAFWAQWGVWITGIGIVGLLVTISQGRLALSRAREANDIARNNSERQLRAYITIEPSGVNEAENGLLAVPMNVINNGQTPAYNLELKGDFLIVGGDPRQFNPAEHGRLGEDKSTTDGNLGPNSNRYSLSYLDEEICEPHWGDIHDKKAAIVHYGTLTYRDVFGHKRETNFAFYHWGGELSDVESKRCRWGNSAN
ncbi:hypothetical protein EON80_31335 [bacterium]|nr:MAG: hypothetical protein EON80_31335 [bacterium]